jgi:hypothetical protein
VLRKPIDGLIRVLEDQDATNGLWRMDFVTVLSGARKELVGDCFFLLRPKSLDPGCGVALDS